MKKRAKTLRLDGREGSTHVSAPALDASQIRVEAAPRVSHRKDFVGPVVESLLMLGLHRFLAVIFQKAYLALQPRDCPVVHDEGLKGEAQEGGVDVV